MYHDDPSWYERPGETVHLTVDANPARHVVPRLPWMTPESMADRARIQRGVRAALLPADPRRCTVCRRWHEALYADVCTYCARAQARDETANARAKQPTPSRPRIHLRENWEVWASTQSVPDPDDLSSGHVREYETRVG